MSLDPSNIYNVGEVKTCETSLSRVPLSLFEPAHETLERHGIYLPGLFAMYADPLSRVHPRQEDSGREKSRRCGSVYFSDLTGQFIKVLQSGKIFFVQRVV